MSYNVGDTVVIEHLMYRTGTERAVITSLSRKWVRVGHGYSQDVYLRSDGTRRAGAAILARIIEVIPA